MNRFTSRATMTGLIVMALVACTHSGPQTLNLTSDVNVEVVFDGSCPTAVVVDTPCASGLGDTVACIQTDQQIEWTAADDRDFDIRFNGIEPCQAKSGKKCKIKKKNQFTFNNVYGLVVKYDIAAQECTFDPYIIIMR